MSWLIKVGISRLIVFQCIEFHRYCLFYKLKVRSFTSKKITICPGLSWLIAVFSNKMWFALLQYSLYWNIHFIAIVWSRPAVLPRNACVSVRHTVTCFTKDVVVSCRLHIRWCSHEIIMELKIVYYLVM